MDPAATLVSFPDLPQLIPATCLHNQVRVSDLPTQNNERVSAHANSAKHIRCGRFILMQYLRDCDGALYLIHDSSHGTISPSNPPYTLQVLVS
jgi:hypothetical protein